MTKTRRKIIKIDEGKCDGCGLCITSCPEGALQIIEGKARLVKESFCDGLGACLGECPTGALTSEKKEVEEYDEKGVIEHRRKETPELLEKHMKHLKGHANETTGCPSAKMLQWEKREVNARDGMEISSELHQWPIQLSLVPESAPYYRDADLILVADCVPFAYANFHKDFLKGNAIAIGCPKLDDFESYVKKVGEIIDKSNIKKLKVVHMEVPCCHGMVHIAREALKGSGRNIHLETVVIGIKEGVLQGAI